MTHPSHKCLEDDDKPEHWKICLGIVEVILEVIKVEGMTLDQLFNHLSIVKACYQNKIEKGKTNESTV